MNSRLIALSAISAGLSAMFLTLGAYVELLDVFCIVLAALPITLPLYRESRTAAFLTFLAGGLLGFLLSGMNIMSLVFPAYFAFFGLHPIVNDLFRRKNVNRWVAKSVKFVWFMAVFFGLYFYYTLIMKIESQYYFSWIADNIYWIWAILGTVVFLVYDEFMRIAQLVANYYLKKIIK